MPAADQREKSLLRPRLPILDRQILRNALRALSSHATACRSLPSSSTSFSGTLWRPLKTRPSETVSSWPGSMPRRSATRSLNQA